MLAYLSSRGRWPEAAQKCVFANITFRKLLTYPKRDNTTSIGNWCRIQRCSIFVLTRNFLRNVGFTLG